MTVLVALVALLPSQSHAAQRAVDVVNNRFEPRALQASAGDTVVWTWPAAGTVQHNVTAYSGPSFASPTQRTGTFSTTFGGGTVLYRCTLHSTLDQGPCSGMCGIISNDTTPPPEPVITQPSSGDTVASPARISGTAAGASTVILWQGATKLGEAVVSNGAWSVDIAMSDGSRTVTAVARSAIGIESQPSAPITFTVDATSPQVLITNPGDLSLTGDPIPAAGSASDDRVLASVRLTLLDLVLGGSSTTIATLGPDGSWTAAVDAPHPGPYTLIARARDAVGNETATTPIRLVVV